MLTYNESSTGFQASVQVVDRLTRLWDAAENTAADDLVKHTITQAVRLAEQTLLRHCRDQEFGLRAAWHDLELLAQTCSVRILSQSSMHFDPRLDTIYRLDILCLCKPEQLVTSTGANVQDDTMGCCKNWREGRRHLFSERLADREPKFGESTRLERFEVCDQEFGRGDGGLKEN